MAQRSPTEVDGIIGEKIRMFRKALKMSQMELGQRLGVTYQQIQKYENGSDRVSASRLYAIAGVLGVSMADFFADTGEADADAGTGEGGLKEALTMPDFIRIGSMFPKITNPTMRRSVVNLVETLAEAGGGPGEAPSAPRRRSRKTSPALTEEQ